MRHPVTRLLHVLISVPVLTAGVIAASPTVHAQESAPAPLVVVIDPGHGGAVDPARPDMPFDPGAIAPSNGLMEKDATLAVSLRLRALLRQDDVNAILTRSDDRGLSVEQRTATANDNQAVVYVSVHFNSFTSSGPNGSLVLYPNPNDLSFAQTMSDALFNRLGPLGVADDGVTLRDNWWIHARMPTVTVEPAYLSNPREASLIADAGFQQVLALAIRSGIESYEPRILQRKALIEAWNGAHPDHTVTAPPPASAHAAVAAHTTVRARAPWLSGPALYGLLLGLLAVVIRWPRQLWRLLRAIARAGQVAVDRLLIRRARRRRRRRAVQLRAMAAHAQRFARPHHLYDDLF